MKQLAIALAATASLVLAAPASARSWDETPEAAMMATDAADIARADMQSKWGDKTLKPGQYLWDSDADVSGPARVIVSLDEQMAYFYRGSELVAVSTISSGKPGHDTPTGVFPIQMKRAVHFSKKYDNAPMPHMQRLDDYGIALHAGFNPGHPASHGCIRLPAKFAAKLFGETEIGTEVLIGA
jgi:hypothetical protein